MLEVEKEGWKIDRCKLCGQPIVWAERTDKPGRIPLDPKAPVFYADNPSIDKPDDICAYQMKRLSEPSKTNRTRLMVSHFATCPAKTRAWKLLEESLEYLEALEVHGGGEMAALIRTIKIYQSRKVQ